MLSIDTLVVHLNQITLMNLNICMMVEVIIKDLNQIFLRQAFIEKFVLLTKDLEKDRINVILRVLSDFPKTLFVIKKSVMLTLLEF